VAGARVVTGRRVSGDLARDPLTATADLVVGADGIWSATRRALDPAAPEPAYAGLYSIAGSSEGTAHRGRDGFNMVLAGRGAFIYLPAPDGTLWWSAQVASAEPPPDPKAVGLAELVPLFPEEPVAAVLRTATTVTAPTVLHVLAPVTRRHDDRTVLVGDAAHPAGAGQGASIAIEDAVALAREVGSAGHLPAALAAFDRVRQNRTGRLARMAAANRDAKTAGPVAARVRETLMPFFFGRFYERATGWLYDHDPGRLPAPVDDLQ
jgi:2-polyprenyl-6-methoxyphenol hydroxylase-like FAD-dependent oxidoreductase